MSKKSYFLKRLIILATALLLAWVGISCKNRNTPTEGGFELKRPDDDKTQEVGDNSGMMDETEKAKYDNEMIHIRTIADSTDGEAYYRNPVVVAYNDNKGFAMFLEKRFGAGGQDDVGVDGTARVSIMYLANNRGGNNLDYREGSGSIIGTSAKEDAEHSKGSPVVFAEGNTITVVAASGSGAMPNRNGRVSEIKIIKGTAGADTINFTGDWEDLNIIFTNDSGTEFAAGSESIKEYVKSKDSSYNSIYTRAGQGKMESGKYLLPLTIIQKNNSGGNVKQGVLVLYSEDSGTTWKFGPMHTFDNNPYRVATGLSISGNEVKLMAVPRVYNDFSPKPIGIFTATLDGTGISRTGQSSFSDSENNFDIYKSAQGNYFMNTRERINSYYNGFVVNQMLTIAILSDTDADSLQEVNSMRIAKACGVGSVVVLADGTIVTLAEEAFAEGSGAGENRMNVVQRRFTKKYVEDHAVMNREEEFYNPEFGSLSD